MISSKTIRLGTFEEAVGDFFEQKSDGENLIVRIGKIDIFLPWELEKNLRPLIGKRIGILHTDIPGKQYLVRIITQKSTEGRDLY